MQIGTKKITWRLSAAVVTKVALLTALAFVLYLAKFNLPFMFPSFLEMQFSELPAMLAGFSMGPVAGVLVVVFKCLLKFPLTSTAYVGELTDMLIGIAYVLPAAIIYRLRKDRKHALIGIGVGMLSEAVLAVIVNRYISIPFYTEMMFGGDLGAIVGVCSAIYPGATEQNGSHRTELLRLLSRSRSGAVQSAALPSDVPSHLPSLQAAERASALGGQEADPQDIR